MGAILQDIPLYSLVLCLCVAGFAGVVKGVVGFAMPMILISLLGSIVAPELALAGLIVPTLVTNLLQFASQGMGAALSSVKRFRVFLGVGGVMLVLSSQLFAFVPVRVFLTALGCLITGFALFQLLGKPLTIRPEHAGRAEWMVGGFAGILGGFSGVWGPPTVAYLTALGTEKEEQIRIQGVIYFLGAVLLALAHLQSGILNSTTVVFSAILVLPAMAGMWVGARMRRSIDQDAFRSATLIVLCIAGLNLLRRAVFG